MTSWLSQLANQLYTLISDVADGIITFLMSAFDRIVSHIKTVAAWLYDLGHEILKKAIHAAHAVIKIVGIFASFIYLGSFGLELISRGEFILPRAIGVVFAGIGTIFLLVAIFGLFRRPSQPIQQVPPVTSGHALLYFGLDFVLIGAIVLCSRNDIRLESPVLAHTQSSIERLYKHVVHVTTSSGNQLPPPGLSTGSSGGTIPPPSPPDQTPTPEPPAPSAPPDSQPNSEVTEEEQVTDPRLHLVHETDPEYSDNAKMLRLQGDVIVSITVNGSGEPTDWRVLKGLGYGLDENALAAVRQWRWEPFTSDSNASPRRAVVTIKFRLR